jgi:serine/arginine repetitive matrix protein 1
VCYCRISTRLRELLGFDDDVVADLVFNTLEQHSSSAGKEVRGGASQIVKPLDPRELQINLTGFLEKQARPFVLELWQMLLSAQSNPTGIPQALLDAKKAELLAAQQAAQQQAAALQAQARAAAGLPPMAAAAPVATPAQPAVPGKRASRFGPPPTVSASMPHRQHAAHRMRLLPSFAYPLPFLLLLPSSIRHACALPKALGTHCLSFLLFPEWTVVGARPPCSPPSQPFPSKCFCRLCTQLPTAAGCWFHGPDAFALSTFFFC